MEPEHTTNIESATLLSHVREKLQRPLSVLALSAATAVGSIASTESAFANHHPKHDGVSVGHAANIYHPAVRTARNSFALGRVARLGRGDWSYFADPRAVEDNQGNVFSGWINEKGSVEVTEYNIVTGKQETVSVGHTGVDDHNNPAMYMRPDHRLTVFFSPHSGRYLPSHIRSEMYYRTTKKPGSIRDWGALKHIPVNAPGGMGYTYPNPIALSNGDMFMAWRGGNWTPTYSILHKTSHGEKWGPAREIVHGEPGKRPYAKFAPGPKGSDIIHMAYTASHPVSTPSGIYYMQYRPGEGLFKADGTRAGSNKNGPLPADAGDTVHALNKVEGSNWVMDVSDDGTGKPVIVYSSGIGSGKDMAYFRYAKWNGAQWEDHEITPAYDQPRHNFAGGTFQTGGIVLDHNDTSRVFLSRVVGGRAEVEEWTTPDGGNTWQEGPTLSPSNQSCFRPAVARADNVARTVVEFSCGEQDHWTKWNTAINARVVPNAAK